MQENIVEKYTKRLQLENYSWAQISSRKQINFDLINFLMIFIWLKKKFINEVS